MAITYEMLFEILRKEKNHEDLQKIDVDFYDELHAYVTEKSRSLSEKPRLDQFVEGHEQEQNAIRTQLQNIKKLIKDIFDRRERKIIEMAINKAKTGSNIIDSSALLPQEKAFFNEQIELIGSFRSEILDSALLMQKPFQKAPESPQTAEQPKELNMALDDPNDNPFKKVHMLESVPKFVGIDLEVYGPFTADEQVALREEIAEMLVKTNKAKIVE
jgi:DNA replication initiation complex subunit (GINS family)